MTYNTSKLKESLRQLIDSHNLNTLELSRRCGIGQPVIYRLVSGETANPRLETLAAIAAYFDLTISQLIGEEPTAKHPKAQDKLAKQLPEYSLKKFLVNGKTKAEGIITTSDTDTACYALKVDTRDLEPVFPEGSSLIINPVLKADSGRYALIKLASQTISEIKKIYFDGDMVCLEPLNAKFATKNILHKNIKVLGVIVKAIVSFR